ncbi:MAG: M14 family metallopeptidase [Acidobacteria bacterium]|nr:M14 family metallopeptidase [Acidobacteriota bacterium]
MPIRLLAVVALLFVLPATAGAQAVPTPAQYFGFEIGTDGELARYPRVLEYLQLLADRTDRVEYEHRGTTTDGNPYVLAKFSSRENLGRLERLIDINHRLADPRGLRDEQAQALAREGVPFYFLYAAIHSTEVGTGQTIINIAHRLATEESPQIREILDNTVVLLVPSQNPDGQILVTDHWYATENTGLNRVYPDLYQRYTGHDDNRDWFMFTQKETRLAIDIHREYKPQITHDMHQMGSRGARMFVPPFRDPHDPNIHPILLEGQAQIGRAMQSALIAAGKKGIISGDQYDLWTPARQYMVYHGQPRILTEIASANLADPYVNPAGPNRPLGPQQARTNFPVPYDSGIWRIGDVVEYGEIATYAALENMAKYRTRWLENFYRVHRDWVNRDEAPYAFVVPGEQRDPFATYEMLEILEFAEVEIHRAQAPFTAGGRRYPAGSWVIPLAQPYGAFAKTMLERQVYPDLRRYPGGPPIPPYDVTGHTLGLLMGVDVDRIDEPLDDRLDLERVGEVRPARTPMPPRPGWAYAVGPESNAGFLAAARLQAAGVPLYRAAEGFRAAGREWAPGTWLVPPAPEATRILDRTAAETGLAVRALDAAPDVDAHRLKDGIRIGLWRAANNMPGGWMMWLFEQYELNHTVVSSLDFEGDLADKYDVIVLPSGTTRRAIVEGLHPSRHDESWRWAYGVGHEGWRKLGTWVEQGGTLVALGSAVGGARELLGLPIEPVLPVRGARRVSTPVRRPSRTPRAAVRDAERQLRDAFRSPAELARTLRARVVDPTSLFFSPGTLLKQEHNPRHPVGYGMPEEWPVFFRFDQAYRLLPSFETPAEVVSRYPDADDMVASGWLLGDEFLREQANVVSFEVGEGRAVTMGSQIAFRTQTRATFKLLFNAIFHGPAEPVTAPELATLR